MAAARIAVTQNVSARAEFVHFDLGSGAYNVLGALPAEGDVDFETLRVGLSYKSGKHIGTCN